MDSHRLSKEAKEGKDVEEGRLFTDLKVCGRAVLFSELWVFVCVRVYLTVWIPLSKPVNLKV